MTKTEEALKELERCLSNIKAWSYPDQDPEEAHRFIQSAVEDARAALSDLRTPEGLEIRYRFPQSVIDYLKSAVKIFGSLSAEQDEQLGLKGGGYMSLESLLRRAESLPEGQEMFAMEHQGDGHLIMAHWVESVVLREAHEGTHDSQHEVYKVVSVLVTKKED